jgi:Tetratricopeptide repeat
VRWNKKPSIKSDKTEKIRTPKRGVVGYSRKSALLEEAITQMNAGKYGRSSAALKELLALDPMNMEARRLFATLHLRLGSLIPAREAFDALITEALQRQDYWLAESLLREYLAAGPRCVPYLEKLGTIYQEKGNTLEAVEEYGKAVDILIEDPDPERPDYAGHLYSKIRELAPASPVAFRLASLFDAATGELVPRRLSAFETDTTLQQDVREEESRDQSVPARADGAMPWDVQVPSDVLEPSGETSHPAEYSELAAQPEHSADSLQQVQSSDHNRVRSGEGVADRTVHHGIDAQTDDVAERFAQEVGAAPTAEEICCLAEQEAVGDSHPSPGLVEVTAETAVAPVEALVAAADSASFPVAAQGSTEASATTPVVEDHAASGATGLDSEQIAYPVDHFSERLAGPHLSPPLQLHEEPPVLFLKKDPSPSASRILVSKNEGAPLQTDKLDRLEVKESSSATLRTEPADLKSIPAPNKEEASFPADKVEQLPAEERASSTDLSTAPAPVSVNEIAQPWKQPGFSWKSVFDTAWKFGEPSPPKDASTSPGLPRQDEIVAEVATAPPLQDRLVEGPTIEIQKREADHKKKDDEALRSPIAPMPWDQVQESVLSIPPVEAYGSSAGVLEPSVDQSQDPDDIPQACDSQAQSSPSRDDSGLEVDSFSLVQPNAPSAGALEPSVDQSQDPDDIPQACDSQAQSSPSRDDSGLEVDSSSLVQPNAPSAGVLEPSVDQSRDPDDIPQARDSQAQSSPSRNDSGSEVDSFSFVETKAPSAEPLEPPVDQPQEPDSTSQACESQLQPSPSINVSDPEPDSFSFVQDVATVHSAERHDSVVEMDAPSTTTEGIEQVVESAPAFSIVGSSQVDESVSPMSETIELQVCTQDPGLGSAVDQAEVRDESTELAITPERARTSAVPEEVGQSPKAEFPAHHSQSVDEVIAEKSETGQPFEPTSIERSTTEPIANDHGDLSESPGSLQALRDDDQPREIEKVHTRSLITESLPPQQERMEGDVSARVSREHTTTSVTPAESAIPDRQDVSQPMPAAHAVADAFVESSRIRRIPETSIRAEEAKQSHKSPAILHRVGTASLEFVRTCFSTTQAIVRTVVGLAMLVGVCFALGIGALALTWMVMDEPPSPTFHSFTTTPQQTLSGAQKNAYTLLVGIDAPAGQDPLRAGYESKTEIGDGTTALGCAGTPGPETGDRSSASANVMRGWIRGSDPIGQFKSHQGAIQGWASRHQVTLERYRQWQKLPFEDWGYGQPISPPCGAMVFAHQLHVVDGFVQGTDVAVDRLETDMEMWRVVLSQARTLPVKMLALQAINDDIALASGLLVRSDFDTKHLGRITKFVRPLDQGELSLRWPMQSELVSAGKTYESQLKAARAEGQAMSAMVASALPLPKQRRLNDYAKYYEMSYQAAGEKHYSSLPKWKDHVRFPAAGVMDYLANPIENLVGVEPLPAWDVYSGLVVDTDAHLRLASLQAWLRRGPSEGALPNKIAKAGQDFYDPYTGLPMLVNQKQGVLYSVGHDGKDQDADPQVDVVVEIPGASTSASQTKSSASSSKPK